MRNVLLQSMLLAMLVIPFIGARQRNPRRGLRLTILLFVAFNVFYLLALRFLYPRLS